jgi:hypothetical protein
MEMEGRMKVVFVWLQEDELSQLRVINYLTCKGDAFPTTVY